ncbi:hypothetical protein LTR94_026334, partial [Friedmanniomyces endolithicus]
QGAKEEPDHDERRQRVKAMPRSAHEKGAEHERESARPESDPSDPAVASGPGQQKLR